MWATLRIVFRNPKYTLIASGAGLMVLSVAVWLPSFALIGEVLFSDTASVVEKINFVLSLYGAIVTNFTLVSASYTILISVLFGVYTALLIFYIYSRQAKSNDTKSFGWMGAGGVASGFLGIGCAACGTFVLGSIAAIGGAGSLLFLPFGGKEFGYLGVVILAYAVYSLSKKIKEPLICK